MSFSCPHCISEQTQKVSIAYQSGITNVNTSTLHGGMLAGHAGLNAGIGTSETSGTLKTAFAGSIAPPQKQSYWKILWTGVKLLFLLGLLVGLMDIKSQIILSIIVWGIIILIGCWCIAAAKFNSSVYPQKLIQWNKNFICLRCGTVFEPQNQEKTGSL